jgi:transcriptional regulator with XRE-family HTH domain
MVFTEKLSINQIDFARIIGYGQPYISLIMNGSRSNPRPLQVTINKLYGIAHHHYNYSKHRH